MVRIWKLFNFLSSLKVAIFLLFLIAISSAIGTGIPQGEISQNYINNYQNSPWLGIINGELLLKLELDHVYSSIWFLTLLAWLGLALIICSWRRQFPSLKSAIKWIHYEKPQQILKLAVAETITTKNSSNSLRELTNFLQKEGWQTKHKKYSLAARKGVIGRFGPPLVHLGLILLMIGATLGAIKGQKFESFLAPGRSIDLISPNKDNKLSFALERFDIQRSPEGQPEQFRSLLKIIDPSNSEPIYKEISVNHPLRYKGLTIYQADWSLEAITIQLGNSPKFQLALNAIPELGEQVWGLILPSLKTDKERILITLSSEDGPVKVFNENGKLLGLSRPGGNPVEINNLDFKVFNVISSSGILVKRDPGIPLVYIGFAITLIGSLLSIISTKLLWVTSLEEANTLYIGGTSNRDLTGFSKEFPKLIKELSQLDFLDP